MALSTSESGFYESPISETRFHVRSQSEQTAPLLQHRNLYLFPPQSTAPPTRTGRHIMHDMADPSTSITASMSSPMSSKKVSTKHFSSIRPRRSKKSIVRAVPATTACATAPLSSLERDMATLPNQEILSSIGRVLPLSEGQASSYPSPQNNSARTHTRSDSGAAFLPTAADHKFPDLKGVIGDYTHGKREWGHRKRGSTSLGFRSFNLAPTRRPQIQVVIPLAKEQRDRPLPTSPFFTSPMKLQSRSPSTDMPSIDGVSPPSASKKSFVRDSIVSPLSAIQQRPARGFHPSIDTQIPKPDLDLLRPKETIHLSNSSSEESQGEDGSSASSNCSSRTSVDGSTSPMHATTTTTTTIPHKRTASAISIKSPMFAQSPDAATNPSQKSGHPGAETGLHVAPLTPSSSRPRRYAPHPRIEEDVGFNPTCTLSRSRRNATMPARIMPTGVAAAKSAPLQRRPTINRKSSKRTSRRRSLLVSPTIGYMEQAVFRVEGKPAAQPVRTPTLSEAENELENELDQHSTSITEENPFIWDDIVIPKSSVSEGSHDDLYSLPPALPRKSSKRESVMITHFRLSKVPDHHIAGQLKRRRDSGKARGLRLDIPDRSRRETEEFFLSPIPIVTRHSSHADEPNLVVPARVAESMLSAVDNLDDLFAMAIVSRVFYRAYKQHELDLMKKVLRKMSPPAWEHRELCYPGHDQHSEHDETRMEYTPTLYLQCYIRDLYIIEALKALISEKCESFLRPEIFSALVRSDAAESARVNDALWRIWNFCRIFGCGRDREDDIVAQMDWLKGGVLVHQQTCTFSILTTDAINMNDTLASAPECFAKGNEGGLTAEQLYDMMELWNCLGMLLQPLEGRTAQAREYGVYDNTDVRGGDIDGEEVMLDEWYYFLLSLGLSPILELAKPCQARNSSAFVLAKRRGWMNWRPPIFGGTRRSFLKEATSRVYEDKIAMVYAESSSREVQRQISKQRIHRHINELRRRQNSTDRQHDNTATQPPPPHPANTWEGSIINRPRPRPRRPNTANLVSHIPTLRSAAPAPPPPPPPARHLLPPSLPELPANDDPNPPTRPRSPPRRTVAQPLLPSPPPSTAPSLADRTSLFSPTAAPPLTQHPAFRPPHAPSTLPSPLIFAQHHPISPLSPPFTPHPHSVFAQHPRQHDVYASDAAQNSADKAIYRIVEMGFTAEQARRALRRTDRGDGLSVERAVELLLREM